jgi:23S rRNA pseudouridine1911/1915/1917 synthase
MRFYFPVPDVPAGPDSPDGLDSGQGILVRNFLRRCAVSTDLARAVKFHGGGFYADGQPILANRRVFAGQVLSFDLPPDEAGGVEPQPEIPVRVVYEDDFAIVLDKPAHLAVHPTLNYPRDTLANGYAALMAARGESPVFRPVNRIDKDTSGLVLAAKNAYAAPLLAERVQKLYLAIAQGELPLGQGVIDAPIGRREGSIIGRCVTPEGKPSRTEYTVECAGNDLSVAACVPVTGRTHQIRVHFASIGHPLAGDDLYGGSRARIGRQALHCARQTFYVPEGRRCADGFRFAMPLRMREITVESPLPPDMAALATLAGKK